MFATTVVLHFQDGPTIRRTNSDHGSGPMGSVVQGSPSLPASNSFPSLSDTVLRQLGALMEEVKQKEIALPKEWVFIFSVSFLRQQHFLLMVHKHCLRDNGPNPLS